MVFVTDELRGWDTSLVSFAVKVKRIGESRGIVVATDGLPDGLRRIMSRTETRPARSAREFHPQPLVERLGYAVLHSRDSILEVLAFVGDVSIAFLRFISGKSNTRRGDLLLVMHEAGIRALPLVSLISLLVGLIFAFVGAIQLRLFGAQIYVADLVGIAMVRAMGAIMTGIIMAGRTGASFAATIGTMQSNEEIDALKTAGISPVEFLVLPRVLGLGLMVPLLTVYADVMGILGGMIVGVAVLGFTVLEYYQETKISIGLTNVWIGIFMGFVFGILVGLSGCLRGMQCGRSALAVGQAATSAVVTGIVSIVIATAIITVLLDILGL